MKDADWKPGDDEVDYMGDTTSEKGASMRPATTPIAPKRGDLPPSQTPRSRTSRRRP